VADAAATVLLVTALLLCGLALTAVAVMGGTILVDRVRGHVRSQRLSAGAASRARR
jgi:hypothetical protein